ncbi:ABC transporter substrate-binding protein [Pinibacter soli]|uniref:ABC transporter substrate-binding protein n=1 Tax=Pinibacter soli TaxID=3044211 RepID=A0ABT6RDV7_9BACT|nr:ABC transporter substrate-binding protein [Pinibacter soli]MDI3320764.1 ABC transporter substrate-binding protein [Pinibacter soli]
MKSERLEITEIRRKFRFCKAIMLGLPKPSICALILCVFMIACHTKQHSNRKIFHYNESTGIASLDPAFAKNQSIMWAIHQLYNTLVEVDSGLNIKPSLAKSWDVNSDKTVFTFHLRTDVFFHDNDVFSGGKGRRLIAKDVEYSFRRIIDKATASSGAWIFNDKIKDANAFKAIDDTTFRLTLVKPFNPVLGLLSMQYCSIVPHEVVEKYGKDFRSHPCGTGPFEIVAWEDGQALIMKRNEHYFERDAAGKQLPYLDGIKVSFYDSKATEFLLFRQGQLDFVNDIEASFKDEILTKKGELKNEWKDKIVLSKHPYLNIEYLGILVDSSNELLKKSPLRFKKVRQAINYAFDRRKMMLYLRNSIGTTAESGFVPQGLPSFDANAVKGYHYDLEKARALLKEAGFADGQNMPVIKLLTIPIYGELGSFVAKQLEDAGIKVQVEVVQKSLLLEQTAKSEAFFFRGSWIADYPDAENYLSVFYSKNPAPPNYTRYNNPAFDALYEKAMQENNDSLRYRIYREMDQMVMNDAPVVPLWYDEVIRLINKDVTGFYPNALNLLELRTVNLHK